jgi:hypothetical protein
MRYGIKRNPFDKVLMAGVFVGIIITVISLLYDAIFLASTGFPYTAIINVSSLIFSINLLFLAIGVIYYGFTRLPKYGNVIFISVFILITVLLLLKVRGVQRTDNEQLNIEFRQLLSVIVVIAGAGAVMLPFLLNNKKFREHVI